MRRPTVIAVLTAICLAAVTERSNAQEPDVTVRIAGADYLGDAPTVIADEQGFFQQRGIRARTVYLDSGKHSLAQLRAGEADFALTALTPLVLDRLADETPGEADDPVIIASLAHSTDLVQIITLESSGIQQAADFRGRRIAVDRGTNSEFVWWLYEQFHEIDRSSIDLVDVRYSEMPDALTTGRVDAAVLWEPRVSILDARLKATSQPRLVHFHVDNLYAGKWVLVTTHHTANNRRALCRNLLAAYREAIDFIDRAPNEPIAVFNRRMDIAQDLPAGHWNALDYNLNLDWGLIANLQQQFLWARAVGYGDAGGQLRVLDLIEPGPLRDLRPEAARVPKADAPNPAP